MIKRMCLLVPVALVVALVVLNPLAGGDPPEKQDKGKAADSPAKDAEKNGKAPDKAAVVLPKGLGGGTYKVEKGPFKVEVACKGVIEAEQMTEIAVSPETWTPDTG